MLENHRKGSRGYSSLFAYAVHELKYSEPAAGRRLAAMKLLVSVPEVASAIETGTLNLSTVCAAQNFFKREETEQGKTYSTEEKKTVLDSLKDKSKHEVEKILVSLSPTSAVGPEKAKPVTETLTEYSSQLKALDPCLLKTLPKAPRRGFGSRGSRGMKGPWCKQGCPRFSSFIKENSQTQSL